VSLSSLPIEEHYVVIGTESWLKGDIGNAEVFMSDFTNFRRDRPARGWGGLICIKNSIGCTELWVDEDFEMIAVEIKGREPKQTWETLGIYGPPNEDMSATERLVARSSPSGNLSRTAL
jgi:hypothetical protein